MVTSRENTDRRPSARGLAPAGVRHGAVRVDLRTQLLIGTNINLLTRERDWSYFTTVFYNFTAP